MFLEDMRDLAYKNDNFRKVLYTGDKAQLVAMCLLPNEDIGEEVHADTDQIFYIIIGSGHARVNNEKKAFKQGDVLFVPAGSLHNVLNTGEENVKLLTVYAPSKHPDGTVQKIKP